MSVAGIHAVYTTTMTSGALSSTAIDFKRTYEKINLDCPSIASGDLRLLVSADGVTYRNLFVDKQNTSTIHAVFSIGSAVVTGGAVIPLPDRPGYRYTKIENTSGATDVIKVFKFICSD